MSTQGSTQDSHQDNSEDITDPYRRRLLYVGIVMKCGKVRRLWGEYVEEDTGLDDPCYRWQGKYRGGIPYVRTHCSSYSVRTVMARQAGRRGKIANRCGNEWCVNYRHLKVIPWSRYMGWVRAHIKQPTGA
jgi:hypothetical protein